MSHTIAQGISFKPHCAIVFSYVVEGRRVSELPKLNKAAGDLSRKAKSRMINAINWMIFLSSGEKYYSKKTKSYHKLHINFITLTLCSTQMHSDQYIQRRLLQPFLKWMRRKGNSLYVWRAETQSNGNIHFHITSNKFLDWKSIQHKWNSLLDKHKYLSEFFKVHGHHSPNSTDVKGVKNVKGLAAYMVKYMSKEDKSRRKVECKIWGCSTSLMNKRLTIKEEDLGFIDCIETLKSSSDIIHKNMFSIALYKSLDARNNMYQKIIKHHHNNAVILQDEQVREKRISSELGGAQQKNKVERRIHMPELWSKTE